MSLERNLIWNEGFATILTSLNYQSIEGLNLCNCGIQEVPGFLLKNCLHLTNLNLSQNAICIRGMETILLKIGGQLVQLSLRSCGITSLPIDLLIRCRNLYLLNVEENNLENMNIDNCMKVVQLLPCLKVLILNRLMHQQNDNRKGEQMIKFIQEYKLTKEFQIKLILASIGSIPRYGMYSFLKTLPLEIIKIIACKIRTKD